MTTAKSAAEIFFDLIIAFLAPMFLFAANGDIALAKAAAIETVNTYRAQNQSDLLNIAQIIAFGLAALGSLSLSMADDISTAMTLRLRANAVASSRAGETCRRALAREALVHARSEPKSHPDEDFSEALAIAAAAEQVRQHKAKTEAVQAPPPVPTADKDQERRTMWADAMTRVAAEVTASLPSLSPEDRRIASTRAAALLGSATETRAGTIGPDALPPHRSGHSAPGPDLRNAN